MNLRSPADERLDMTQWGCSRVSSSHQQAHMKTINYVSFKLSLHWVIHLWNELFFPHHLSVWLEGYYFLMRDFFLYAPGYKVNHWILARWCASPISNDIEKSSLSLFFITTSKDRLISLPMKLRNESSDNDEQLEHFSQYGLYSYTRCLFTPPAVNIALISLELREFNHIAF